MAEDCAELVARVCPASRGDLDLLACFRAHETQIAVVCPGDPDAVLAHSEELGGRCRKDIAERCKGVQGGEGRVVACLRNNESQLSQDCQSAFNEWRLGQMEVRSRCASEIASLCGTVPAGGGRILHCLRRHERDLGSDCRSTIQKL